jgi:hypothetical protein
MRMQPMANKRTFMDSPRERCATSKTPLRREKQAQAVKPIDARRMRFGPAAETLQWPRLRFAPFVLGETHVFPPPR